jgi:PAS domain S-box-containing protein
VPERQQDRSNSSEAEKRMTLSSRESERRYRRLFETAQDGILIIDFDSERITYANPFLTQLLGYPHYELVGKTVWEIGPFSDLVQSKAAFDELKTKGSIRYEDLPLATKDGEQRRVEFVGYVYALDGARVIQCNVRDMTERKQAEVAMRRQADLLQKTFDSMTDAVFILDAKLPAPTITECNQAACTVFGYDRMEMLGRSTQFLHVSDETLKEFQALLYSAVEEGHLPFHLAEFHMKRKNGSIFPSEHTISQLTNDEGERIAWVSIVRDIAERKRMEEALGESEESYRLLFGKSPIGIGLATPDGKIVSANETMQAIIGYSAEELKHINLADIYENSVDRRRLLETLQRNGNITNYSVRLMRKDGTTCDALLSVSRIHVAGKDLIQTTCIDITERRRMEDELRRLSQFRESVIDNAHVWLDVLDEKGNVLVWNKAAEAISGYSREEVIGHDKIWEWLYPDEAYRRYLTGLVADVIQRGRVEEDFETAVKRKDGQIRTISWNERGLMSEDGKVIGSIALGRDVTEHKKMEEELRRYSMQLEQLVAERTRELAASKDFAENLIQTANAMVVGLDNQGNVRFFNQATEKITGYSSRELQGRDWFEAIVPRNRYPEVWTELERLRTGGLPKNFENPILTKSGEERYIIWQNNVVREHGKVVGTISFGIDITPRKLAEEQLRAARERLQYVVAANPAIIYTGKPVTDGSDFVLTYISERISAMFGFEPTDFIGHPEFWDSHIHPEDRRTVLEEMPLLWKKGQHAFEYRFLHRDGAYRWIHEEARVVRDADGKPIEVNGYWTDVSERKRLEEELAKSHRLAVIGETSAMIGHDLRNPLQGIAGVVYLAKKNLESRRTADRKATVALLDTIEEQVLYMDKIVSDLQDYAQPLAPQLTETNLPNLIKQTLSTIKMPETVKVSVKMEKLATNAMVDSTLMRRTLTNLTINAIQAMPKRGKLTIQARSRGDSIILTVEDTGVGIPRKNLAKIFDPFFTTKARGQGLGLAVCKRLVEAQGGTISVKSKPRKGTAFTIKLRRGKKEVAS